LKLIRPSVAPL